MKRRLSILLALMTLIICVLLCSCTENNKSGDDIDVTELTSESGIVISGGTFKSDTKIVLKEINDQEVIDGIKQKLEPYNSFEKQYGFCYSLCKVIDVSLYMGEYKIYKEGFFDYHIPGECVNLESPNCNEYILFYVNNTGELEEVFGDINDNASFDFTSTMPKYIVITKISLDEEIDPNSEDDTPHVHDYYLCLENKPTFFKDGHITYYYCYDCRKYFDEDFNEISEESTIIPKLSRNLVLNVNGEKRAEFTVQGDSDESLTAELTGISLKKDDLITFTTNDKLGAQVICYPEAIYTDADNNFSLLRNGKVHNDVDAATITIRGDRFGQLGIYISGVKYDIYYRHSVGSAINMVEPDSNGVISLKQFKTHDGAWLILFNKVYDIFDYIRGFELSTELSSEVVSISDNGGSLYFKETGYYDIDFDLNSKIVSVKYTENMPTMISYGNLASFKTGAYMPYYISTISCSEFNEDKTEWNAYIPKYAVYNSDKYLCILDSKNEAVNDMFVAEDSKEYISVNECYIYFLQDGSYDIYINDVTHEVRVVYLSDGTPVYKAKLEMPHNSSNSVVYSFAKTDDDNILVLESELFVYAGYELRIYNEKDYEDDFTKLEDSLDAEYASGTSRLYFHKGGVYKIYFNTSTLKVNIELVRELTGDEILIPNTVERYNKRYNLIENPNNNDEMCLLNVIIENYYYNNIRYGNYQYDEDNYFEFGVIVEGNTYPTKYVNDIYMEGESDNYYIDKPTNGLSYGRLLIKNPGTYNIFINKTTHEVRVEEVV